jgi:hypothetical protein
VLHTKQKQYNEAELLFNEALEVRKNNLGETIRIPWNPKTTWPCCLKSKLATMTQNNYSSKQSKAGV